MPRRKRSADIDVEVSEDVDAEEVEVEQVPEEAPVASPEVKAAPRGVGGEYVKS